MLRQSEANHSSSATGSYLRHRVLRGCPLFRPVARYSKSSVNSWFSPNSTTSLKCFTCWTTVYSWKIQRGIHPKYSNTNMFIYFLQLYGFRIGKYLLVLFAAFECGDCVLVEISGDGDTLCDLGWRRRSLENAIILLGVGGLLTGSSC